jgi:hypothetical protein
MTWSLGVEEQFYLVFPLVLWIFFKPGSRSLFLPLLFLSIASFMVNLLWTWRYPSAAFYLLPARAWELGAGTLAVMVERSGREDIRRSRGGLIEEGIAAIGLGLSVTAVVAFDDKAAFPGWLALLPVAGTLALLASPGSFINRRVLGARPVVFVGLISYSWYLWHWPMMSLLHIVVPSPLSTAALVAAAVLSFGFAVLSWRFVETPFRTMRYPPLAILGGYAVATSIALAVPISICLSRGFPDRLSARARALEAVATDLRASRCLVSKGKHLSEDAGCRSTPAGRPVVALLGDSHAWALQPGVRAAAKRQRYGFVILARASCPPLLGVTVRSNIYPNLAADCVAFNAAALANIVNDPRVSSVVLAGYWSAPVRQRPESAYLDAGGAAKPGLVLLYEGLRSMVGALRLAGKHVILVDDVPNWTFDPLRTALADAIPARRVIASLLDPNMRRLRQGWLPADDVPRHDDVRAVIANVAAQDAQIGRVDAFSAFCGPTDRCSFSDGEAPFFFDKDHLSPAGSMRALGSLTLHR